MIAVPETYICLDDNGVAYIAGTNTKVVEIVREKNAWQQSAEEIQANHTHLSLSQVHAALAYYYDHKREVDADIARRDSFIESIQAQATQQVTRQELEARMQQKVDKNGA